MGGSCYRETKGCGLASQEKQLTKAEAKIQSQEWKVEALVAKVFSEGETQTEPPPQQTASSDGGYESAGTPSDSGRKRYYAEAATQGKSRGPTGSRPLPGEGRPQPTEGQHARTATPRCDTK